MTTDPPATSRQGARRGSPDGFPATPATEAGEVLYRWFRGKSEITGNRLDVETARHIAEVEAEAARDALLALPWEQARTAMKGARGLALDHDDVALDDELGDAIEAMDDAIYGKPIDPYPEVSA